MVVDKRLPTRAIPTPATRQRQKIVMIKQCCKLWSNSMPVLMNTWRPKHGHESDDEYRRRVVEAGDGDIYRGMQILHRALDRQSDIISMLLDDSASGTQSEVASMVCTVCGRTYYVVNNQKENDVHDQEPTCYICHCIRKDTREWLNKDNQELK